MTEVVSMVAGFVIPGVGELIVVALSTAVKLVNQMKENEEICKRVYKRMEFVYDELQKLTDDKVLRERNTLALYDQTIANFLEFLKEHSQKGFIKRLASNRQGRGVEDQMEGGSGARPQGERRYLGHNKAAQDEVHNTNVNVQEGLASIVYELRYKNDQNDLVLMQFMEKVVNMVVGLSKTAVPDVREWFIPRDVVDFDIDNAFDGGSYGSVHHGTWGKGTKVVVKALLMDDEMAKDSFFKEVQDAVGGNFADYFAQNKNEIWRLFYEDAVGLYYLHSQKVVHGDLKCNNIVVGADGTAKICDFGFSYIRSQSVGLSAKAQTNTIRWKAPECLMGTGGDGDANRNPKSASDVFSFGMCIIEAFSNEPPYGTDDDDAIMDKIFKGAEYPRPEGLQDDEWELVQMLCRPEWEERIPLVDAIAMLKSFEEREKESNAALECPGCIKSISGTDTFCRHCACKIESKTAVPVVPFDRALGSQLGDLPLSA